MFKKKTVIIVGAGASKEAELPLGYELKNQIAELTKFTFGPSLNEARRTMASNMGTMIFIMSFADPRSSLNMLGVSDRRAQKFLAG